jgi:hypothetical protein
VIWDIRPLNISVRYVLSIQGGYRLSPVEIFIDGERAENIQSLFRRRYTLTFSNTNPFLKYTVEASHYARKGEGEYALVKTDVFTISGNTTSLTPSFDKVKLNITKQLVDNEAVYYSQNILTREYNVFPRALEGSNETGFLNNDTLYVLIALALILAPGFILFEHVKNYNGFLLGIALGLVLTLIADLIPLGWGVLMLMLISMYFIIQSRGGLM